MNGSCAGHLWIGGFGTCAAELPRAYLGALVSFTLVAEDGTRTRSSVERRLFPIAVRIKRDFLELDAFRRALVLVQRLQITQAAAVARL